MYCSMAFTVAAALAGEKDAPKAVAKINIGVSAGMVVGVPISNFLAESVSLAASISFFATATFLVMIATAVFVPSMNEISEKKAATYGEQLSVLKKPMVWAAIFAVIFLNGSIFGVFNYLADYLDRVTLLSPGLIGVMLFVYGVCNIFGSMLSGNLLTRVPTATVKIFPFALAAVYFLMLFGGSAWPYMAPLTIAWGILGGINANINQFWLSHAAPEAPDFANGLFLTAANIGCMAGTAFSGAFIDFMGIAAVVWGGIFFLIAAVLLFWSQCKNENLNPLSELRPSV